MVTEDGTGIPLTKLIPFAQDVGKDGLKTDTVVKAGQDYPKSLLVPGTSRVGYKLSGKYRRFKARVGLTSASRKGKNPLTTYFFKLPRIGTKRSPKLRTIAI